MILIASSNPKLASECRRILDPLYPLYEVDITERHDLELCLKKNEATILILDIALLGEFGITEIADIKEISPNVKIILMTSAPEEREEISAVLYGVKAYCHAENDLANLPKVIATILKNELWVDRRFLTRLLAEIEDITTLKKQETKQLDSGIAKLTPREVEIAECIAQGASNRKIAETLSITERTVKAHLGFIFKKLGLSDRLQLALYLNRHHQIASVWHPDHKKE